MVDRGVLQANQANPQAGRFPGLQRQRGALADMERAAVLPAAAIPGIRLGLGQQFHPALHARSRRALAASGPGRPAAALLWDSRRQLPGISHARTGVFP